jgi:hypothetical protein
MCFNHKTETQTMTIRNLVPLTSAMTVMPYMGEGEAERFVEDQRRRWAAQVEQHDGHSNRANMVGYEAMAQVMASEKAAKTPTDRTDNVRRLKAV